jgi:hypothetical protein
MQPSMIINAPCQKNERSVSWADPIILSWRKTYANSNYQPYLGTSTWSSPQLIVRSEGMRGSKKSTASNQHYWNTLKYFFYYLTYNLFYYIYILRLSKIQTCHHLFYLSIGSAFHPAVRCKESLSEG